MENLAVMKIQSLAFVSDFDLGRPEKNVPNFGHCPKDLDILSLDILRQLKSPILAPNLDNNEKKILPKTKDLNLQHSGYQKKKWSF